MSDGEYDHTPGLPAPLPAGETVLWQGRPDWKALAIGAYRLKAIGLYFAVLAVWRAVAAIQAGGGIVDAARDAAWLLPMAALAVSILLGLAYLSARATIYTVTNRRVVMRIGAALPITLNLPFSAISTAALGRHRSGHGDIPLTLCKPGGLGYLVLWPHARPWHFARPEPMLRALPDAEHVAKLLAEGLATVHAEAPLTQRVTAETNRPVRDGALEASPARRGRRRGGQAALAS